MHCSLVVLLWDFSGCCHGNLQLPRQLSTVMSLAGVSLSMLINYDEHTVRLKSTGSQSPAISVLLCSNQLLFSLCSFLLKLS